MVMVVVMEHTGASILVMVVVMEHTGASILVRT